MRSGGGQRAESLGQHEVHAWLADLDSPGAAAAAALLDPAERGRAGSYARLRDGARFGASRGWLRLILGRYLDAEPASLRFTTATDRRPALTGAHAGGMQFSLSRSAGRALIAVSRMPVGADIEAVSMRPGLADLIASRFGAAEVACIFTGCGGSLARGFYRHWTAKEAYLKATGRGLAGLRATELTCGALPAIRVGGTTARDWTLSLFEAAPDCAAAIVGASRVTRCRPAG
jgi:4'-phosphopantetheinyl transferase